MKKIYFYLPLFLLPFTLITACSDDDPSGNGEQEELPTITVDNMPDTAVPNEGGTLQIQFTASAAWTAKADQAWCTVAPKSGEAGTYTLTATMSENEGYDERNTSVVVTAGRTSKYITVTQKQKDAMLLTSNKVEVGAGEESISLKLKTNVEVSYEIDEAAASWIKAPTTAARGLKEETLTFTVAANDRTVKRQGIITLKGGENLSEQVTVYQEGAEPSLMLTRDIYELGSRETSIKVELQSNTDFDVKIDEKAGWLTVDKTQEPSTYTRYFRIAANESEENRSATIVFKAAESELSDTLTVWQIRSGALLVAHDTYKFEDRTETLTFPLNTNESVTVSSSCDWIHVPETVGEGVVTLTIDKNTSYDRREGILTASDGTRTQQITIVQEGKAKTTYFSVTHDCPEFTVPSFAGRSDMKGNIQWGDGSKETYGKGVSHTYANAQPHTVVIEMTGADEVSLPDLTGITELDFTEF